MGTLNCDFYSNIKYISSIHYKIHSSLRSESKITILKMSKNYCFPLDVFHTEKKVLKNDSTNKEVPVG